MLSVKEITQMNLQNSNRVTDTEDKLMVAGGRGKMRGRDSQGVGDGLVHTAIFKMGDQQGPTVQHMELCSILCGRLDGRGVCGRRDPCICMTEFLRCSPETTTTLLIGYTPVQNEKF